MNEKFLSPYDPQSIEETILKRWEQYDYYNPDTMIRDGIIDAQAEPFSMVLPPPNVTGTLHTGHASMIAIEDIMVRYKRMCGYRTLWIPGTDHAAIATQSKVEKLLQKEKIRKHDIGREAFLKHVHDFADDSQSTILSQVKKMGASVDWSRLAYTLDEEREQAVRTAFKNMYDDGLIYRDYRIVNWDPKGQTVISDDEIVHQERKAIMYTFKYSEDFPFAISTTRPETKVGDTAVAVHPNDERYQEYIGNTYTVAFCGTTLEITIIADEHVDMDFGTGALGVTPAHSQADWDIAQRHNLPYRQVINEYAKMMDCGSILKGLKVQAAREAVVHWLTEQNLIIDQEELVQNVSTAERTGGIIEPLPKLQWWIDTEKPFTFSTDKVEGISKGEQLTLKDAMLRVVKNGTISILPDRFEKVYNNWIENLRPWNISRQIWFGHQVPVWYRDDEIYVGTEAPSGEGWVQDEDTLDTWFSSGLWTFSTLGWPNKTDDFATYHPTSVLETGYDIIFFWVARMILMSLYHIGDIPFETVYLHGLIRDAHGRKMSKSLGNIVDPIELSDRYGTDAVRMGIIVGNGPGNDVNLDEQKIKAYSKFANKLWNITRFLLTEVQDYQADAPVNSEDQQLVDESQQLIKEITNEMNDFKFYLVGEKLYHYLWHRYADEILESSKKVFESGTQEDIASRKRILIDIFTDHIKALHPFMPFITEELWAHMPSEVKQHNLLMVEPWPNNHA
jgi:valyl-tRNA synthetase